MLNCYPVPPLKVIWFPKKMLQNVKAQFQANSRPIQIQKQIQRLCNIFETRLILETNAQKVILKLKLFNHILQIIQKCPLFLVCLVVKDDL